MNPILSDFLALFRSSLHDTKPEKLQSNNISEIKKTADKHNAWPLVFMQLQSMYKENETPCEEWADFRNKFFFQCVKNMQHMYALRKILAALENAGIPYAILKGESLAHLYPHPECRVSSDIDLFVFPEDEARAVDTLIQCGMQVAPRIPHVHHCNCKGKACGKIELHIKWQGDLQNEILYNNMLTPEEPFIQTQTEALGTFYTIGINDGLYFHFSHLMTHFIAGGFGIRLISDLLLYIRKYKAELDEARFRAFLDTLGYNKFMDTLFGIGVKHLGFDKNDFFAFTQDDAAVDVLLDDCLTGGAFGHAEPGRFGTHDAFLKARMEQSGESYDKYKADYKASTYKEKLSFGYTNIAHRYHYVRKNKLLLPVAYIHHLYYIASRVCTKLLTRKNAAPTTQMHKNAQKREQLLEILELKKH